MIRRVFHARTKDQADALAEECKAIGWDILSIRQHKLNLRWLITCEIESEMLEYHALKELRLRVLKECGGNRSLAAHRLGISVRSLYKWLKEYDNV